MKISIITPTFNSEKTIERTINSVLSQQADCQLEYIVVDGASTDSTLEKIHKYKAHIKTIISEPDSGPYDAMNKGIKNASGEIIGIINSDDWYNTGSIELVNQTFLEHNNIDIVYSPIDNFYKNQFVATFHPGDLEKLSIRFTLNHPSCFIKKAVYDALGSYDLKYGIAADYDFILRSYLADYDFYYVDKPLAAYSLNGLSSSTNPRDRIKLIRESWQVGEKFDDQFSQEIKNQRKKAYLAWIINEIFALPARHFLKPPLARDIKMSLKKYIQSPVAESFGKW